MIKRRSSKINGLFISAIWVENNKEINVKMSVGHKGIWRHFKSSAPVKNIEIVGNALYNEYQHQKVKNWMDTL
jgi:hypothetical protein